MSADIATLRKRLLTADQLDDIPPPSYLLDKWLVADSLCVLYGMPGVFKSFIALAWALCVATGCSWLGHRTQQGSVLYIAAEGATGLGIRKKAWAQHNRIHTVDGLFVLPDPVNLLDANAVDALVELTDEKQPVLIVMDTLNRSMVGGDENSSRDMGMVIEATEALRRCSRATVVLIHHTTKDGMTARGHSSLEGAAQTMVECSAVESRLKLKVKKQKDDEPVELLGLRVPVGDSCVIESNDGRWTPGESKESESKLFAAVLDAAGLDGLPPSELITISALPRSTYFIAQKSLVAAGVLTNVGTKNRPRYAATQELLP